MVVFPAYYVSFTMKIKDWNMENHLLESGKTSEPNLQMLPPSKTNMTMENPPFEDVFPIQNVAFRMSC